LTFNKGKKNFPTTILKRAKSWFICPISKNRMFNNNYSDRVGLVESNKYDPINPTVFKRSKSWFVCPNTKKLISNPAVAVHDEAKELSHFQKVFSYNSNELLISSFGAYIMKVFPHLGTVYISTNNISFRSMLAGSRAKCIIPLSQILKLEKTKGYFNYGLTIHTSDHEQINFEFHKENSLRKCYELLQTLTNNTIVSPLPVTAADSLTDVTHLEKHLETSFTQSNQVIYDPPSITIPAPMRIAFITIGTRGDVQPYIALCLGFMKDKHHCILATHLEYKAWIESFGIEFREIKGNPAELMQLCVDYGMFTPRFIYNATTSVSFI
jgi:sterol 3beta-glucosyltransferase